MSAPHPTRVFVAGHYGELARAKSFAAKLAADHHKVDSDWHNRRWRDQSKLPLDELWRIAEQNQRDVDAAKALVLLWHRDCRSSLVEYEQAWRLGHKNVVIVGDELDVARTAPGLLHRGVKFVADEAEAIKVLR